MRLKELVAEGDPEKLAGGFQFLEGPLWMPDGGLLFSDIPADRIYRYANGDVGVWREPSGQANGLTLDDKGQLIACEHGRRRVSRTLPDGRVVPAADSYQDHKFNSPNDVVVRSDGTIYFTDPPYGIKPEQAEQPCNGVYAVRTDGSVLRVAEDFDRPNGLAFSPDESMLYIDDSRRRHVRRFQVHGDASLGADEIFADMDHPQPGSPDGMKVDQAGNLYVAGATGIWVFEPDGAFLGVLVTPERPSNLAWGGADGRTLYITARTSLYAFQTNVGGIPAGG